MKYKRILFICKKRPACYGVSYGLLNSCRFLANALKDMGFEAKVVEVRDNNDIDREVTLYKPTHAFVEALWVVPSKFNELIPLHPKVNWYVRLHSNVPFIANEGVAMSWIIQYLALGVRFKQFKVCANDDRMVNDLEKTFKEKIVYAPNIYRPGDYVDLPQLLPDLPTLLGKKPEVIDIGCFGAIRILKDQLIQAMAAIVFANEMKVHLNFHMNDTRIENQGEGIYRNLQALFVGTGHTLVSHSWLEHPEFMKLVRQMDLGMQVSFSETFDIVAADFAIANVPVVGSTEIKWLSPLYKARPTDMNDIVSHLWTAWQGKKVGLQLVNRKGLCEWNDDAEKVWEKLIKH